MKKTLVIMMTSLIFFSVNPVLAKDKPKNKPAKDNHLILSAVPHDLNVGESAEMISFHRKPNGAIQDISVSGTVNDGGVIEHTQKTYTNKAIPKIQKYFSEKELSSLADRIYELTTPSN